MVSSEYQADFMLAREVCEELRIGNNEAILGIYNKYHPFFLAFTTKRIPSFDKDRALSILNDFWVELLNAKAICDFQGLATLKTYLFKVLNFRILDNVRRGNRQGAYSKNVSDKDHEIDGFVSGDESPEQGLMQKEKIRLIHESLLMLSESAPSDAYLVKMHLEGLAYNQMAERMVGGQGADQKELDKKVGALKKQFTREGTGSLAKFRGCLEKVMRKNNLVYTDILN
ncbi:MAG: hypothetical protein ABIL58_14005 [Pseudomonadota bacterium]